MNFQPLTDYLDSFYTQKNLPMAGCAVYYRHQPVYEYCTGFSHVEEKRPLRPDTLVHLFQPVKPPQSPPGCSWPKEGCWT